MEAIPLDRSGKTGTGRPPRAGLAVCAAQTKSPGRMTADFLKQKAAPLIHRRLHSELSYTDKEKRQAQGHRCRACPCPPSHPPERVRVRVQKRSRLCRRGLFSMPTGCLRTNKKPQPFGQGFNYGMQSIKPSVRCHNGLLSFEGAGRTSVNDLVKPGRQR
jgi:hypothetical protein